MNECSCWGGVPSGVCPEHELSWVSQELRQVGWGQMGRALRASSLSPAGEQRVRHGT